MLFQVTTFANEDEPVGSLFKSAATYANTILAARTPSPAQAPLTSFRTRSPTTLYSTVSVTRSSHKLQSQICNIKCTRNRQGRATAPKPVLTRYSVLKKSPSRISKLRVHYSHKQQPCVQALAFTRQLHVVSQTFQGKNTGKASSAFKYQYPQFLLKATSPAKGSIT